jgi:hypothetical protein
MLVDSGSSYAIIRAFMDFTSDEKLSEDNGRYLIYLLDALCNFTIYDNGIEPILGTHATACFNKILAKPNIKRMGPYTQRIREFCLRIVGNMSLNHLGKQECIDE